MLCLFMTYLLLIGSYKGQSIFHSFLGPIAASQGTRLVAVSTGTWLPGPDLCRVAAEKLMHLWLRALIWKAFYFSLCSNCVGSAAQEGSPSDCPWAVRSSRFPLRVAVVAISCVTGGRHLYNHICLGHPRASGVGKLTQASSTQRFFAPLPDPCRAAGSGAPRRAQKRGWRQGGRRCRTVGAIGGLASRPTPLWTAAASSLPIAFPFA